MPFIASHDHFRGPASIRTSVTVPLAFPDGYETVAQVFTFRGLADGKEHLLLALGDWQHTTVALLSNNPDKAAQLEGLGITVADRQPTGVFAREANRRYLETKVLSTGHTIDLPMPLLAA